MTNLNSDAADIIAVAKEATAIQEVDASKLYVHNGEILNLQDFQPTPRRKRDKTTHFTAASLAAYANEHRDEHHRLRQPLRWEPGRVERQAAPDGGAFRVLPGRSERDLPRGSRSTSSVPG